jgi:hypothetical protein
MGQAETSDREPLSLRRKFLLSRSKGRGYVSGELLTGSYYVDKD